MLVIAMLPGREAEIKLSQGSRIMSARDAACCSRGQAPSSTATWLPEAATHVRGNVSPDWTETQRLVEQQKETEVISRWAPISHTHSAARQRQRGNKLVKGSLLIEIAAWSSSLPSSHPPYRCLTDTTSDVSAIMTCPDKCVSESSPMNRPVSNL